jgi:site-specific DNA-methyltransferase (adenine-specific)
MPTIPSGSIDAIITDLPYGTTACKWDTVIEFAPMWKEVKRLLKPSGAFITTASQPFTSALIMSDLDYFKYELIWDKNYSGAPGLAKYRPMPTHENIEVFGSGRITYNPQMQKGKPYTDIRKNAGEKLKNNEHKLGYKIHQPVFNDGTRYPKSVIFEQKYNKKGQHPTQKPVALYEYLIKTYTNEGETVLDIAMGSGTTIEAAERTGRNSIGIEKDEGIFQSAVLRLKSFTPSNNRLHLTGGTVPAQGDLFTPEDLPSEGKLPAPTPRR